MGIQFDNVGGASYDASASSTISFAVAAKPNRLLVVSAGYYQSGRGLFTTMSYNGVDMTANLIGDVYQNSTVRINLFYLLAPDIGTHNLQWAISGGTARVRVNILSYYNVQQQPPLATQQAGGNSANASLSLATTPRSWIIGGGHKQSALSVTPGTDTNLRVQAAAGVGLGFAGDEAGQGGSQTFNFTLSANNWALAAGVWQAAAPQSGPIHFY